MNTFECNGLVLAGGASSRMGTDKAMLNYYGIPQWKRVALLLQPYCQHVFISRAREQTPLESYPFDILLDQPAGHRGPLAGILAALRQYPNTHWITAPADMPQLPAAAFNELIHGHDAATVAVCFEVDSHIEPLVALWKAAALQHLETFCEAGGKSPQEFLRTHPTTVISTHHPEWFVNVNTPDEWRAWKARHREHGQ